MKGILKLLYVVVSLGLFFVVEAFCASRIIWYYNWSNIEEIYLRSWMCAVIGFDLIVFLLRRLKEPVIPAFPVFVVKFEMFVAILISCVLLGAFLVGTLETNRLVSALLNQFFVILIKFLEITWKPRSVSPIPSGEPDDS